MTRKLKLTERPREQKSFHPIIVKVDEAQGIVEAIVNLYGIVDQGDDIVHLGCFRKSIDERQGKIRCLNNHSNMLIQDIVGKPVSIQEIGREMLPLEVQAKYPSATGGLLTITQFYLETDDDRMVFKRVADGQTEWSIGFTAVQVDFGKVTTPEGKTVTVRNIREAALWEYSPVLWGMNQGTATLSAKTDSLPEPADDPQPEQEKEYTPDGAQARVGDYLAGCMMTSVHGEMDDMLQHGTLDYTEYSSLVSLADRCVGDFRKMMDDNVALRPHEGGMGMLMDLFWALDPKRAQKSGRVLSARNAEKIRNALDNLMSVLQDAGVYEDASEDEPTESESQAEPPEKALTVDALKVELELIEAQLEVLR